MSETGNEYGKIVQVIGPVVDVAPVEVVATEISFDRRSVFLKTNTLTPRKIYEFNLPGLANQNGKKLRQHMAYYTLNELSESKFVASYIRNTTLTIPK